MLTYVDKLTRTPWQMVRADVDKLRQAGFDDWAILDINQVAAYFAYVNRLADGLGVEIETTFAHDPDDRDSLRQAGERWRQAYS